MQVISSNQCSQAAALCTHGLKVVSCGHLTLHWTRLLTMAVGLKSYQTATFTRQNAEWVYALHDGRSRLRLSFGWMYALSTERCARQYVVPWISLGLPSDLSYRSNCQSWKVVYIGQADLGWTLNCWKQPWMWANHAITVEQSLVSNICFSRGLYVLLVEQVSALKSLALWRNVTWKYRRTDTQDYYRRPLGLRPPRHN